MKNNEDTPPTRTLYGWKCRCLEAESEILSLRAAIKREREKCLSELHGLGGTKDV